jgi:hypothetical protein
VSWQSAFACSYSEWHSYWSHAPVPGRLLTAQEKGQARSSPNELSDPRVGSLEGDPIRHCVSQEGER